MAKSLGKRLGRRRRPEVEASPPAVYLKVLGELGALSFDPELRTAAQLLGFSPSDERTEPPKAFPRGLALVVTDGPVDRSETVADDPSEVRRPLR